MRVSHVLALCTLTIVSSAGNAQEIDWKKVDDALGRSAVVTNDVHRYGFPRTDLQVTLDGVSIRPAFALGGVETLPGQFLDFLDPWGNRVEIVGYDSIQFTKAPNVLRGMGLSHLAKNEKATKELTDKGM